MRHVPEIQLAESSFQSAAIWQFLKAASVTRQAAKTWVLEHSEAELTCSRTRLLSWKPAQMISASLPKIITVITHQSTTIGTEKLNDFCGVGKNHSDSRSPTPNWAGLRRLLCLRWLRVQGAVRVGVGVAIILRPKIIMLSIVRIQATLALIRRTLQPKNFTQSIVRTPVNLAIV